MDMEFYDSEDAKKMAEEYRRAGLTQHFPNSHSDNESINHPHVNREKGSTVGELLIDADGLEKQAKAVTSIFLRRRRVRLELQLQRKLLEILLVLTPDDQELGRAIYDRLLNCVARLENLC